LKFVVYKIIGVKWYTTIKFILSFVKK